MINFEQPKSTGLLRSLLLFILILFGFWMLNDQGLVGIVLEGDKSHISKAIGVLWFLTSIILSSETWKAKTELPT